MTILEVRGAIAPPRPPLAPPLYSTIICLRWYCSTMAIFFLHFYMFSILVVELFWASHSKFFLHLAYTIPIVNAQLYV